MDFPVYNLTGFVFSMYVYMHNTKVILVITGLPQLKETF